MESAEHGSAAHWKRLEAALDALVDLPAADRAAAIDRLAGADAALHAELWALCRSMDGDDALLDRPAAAGLTEPSAVGASADSLLPGALLGPWRLVAPIGRGGMGEVYRAERADGTYTQQVAIKLLQPGRFDDTQRFEQERQTLARLDHPGIARLLDGGVAADGRPYMVIELVDGRPLMAWCRAHDSPLAERLRLFGQVCDAVAYAHRNLVVHRDIKPGNVLVGADGTVKLLDFGIAKLLAAPDSPATQTLNMPLTPGYAAPEQLLQGPITTATDVYALGVLLFELLTGAPPWRQGPSTVASMLDQTLRDTAPAPSRFAARQADPALPPRLLRGDLDAIVAKAVRKEPAARYADARALAEDLQRAQAHRPVQARDGARAYVLQRFVQRHWLPLSVAALSFVLLLGAIATTAWQARLAREEARKALEVKNFLLDIFKQNSYARADPQQARHATAEELLDIGAARIQRDLQQQPAVRGELTDTLADLYLNDLGAFDRVITLERAWLADLQRSEGNGPSPMQAAAQSKLGQALTHVEQPGAEAQLRAALHSLDQLGDQRSLLRVETLLGLSALVLDRKPANDPEAGQAALAALRLTEAFHPQSEQRLLALNQLAQVAYDHLDDAQAERWFRAEYALADSPTCPNRGYWLVNASRDLGNFLRTRHRFAEAEPFLRRAVSEAARIDPDQRLLTSTSKEQLSRLLMLLNQPDEAQATLTAALAEAEHSQGADDAHDAARMRYELASMLISRGNWPEAARLLQRNLDLYARIHADSPHTWTFVLAAQVAAYQGRGDDARRLALKARELMTERHQTGYDGYGTNQVTLAELERMAGRPAAAVPLYRQVMAGWPPQGEYLTAHYVLAETGLVRALLALRQDNDAVAVARRLTDRLLALKEHDHLALAEAQAQEALGLALTHDNQPTNAEPHLRRAVALREKLDVPDSPWLAQARISLAECRRAQGDAAEARSLLTAAATVLTHQPALAGEFRRALQQAQAALRRQAPSAASAQRSQARALTQSRRTVRSVSPSAAAVSSSV